MPYRVINFFAETHLPFWFDAGLDVMDYDKRGGAYRLRLSKSDIKKNADLLIRLLKASAGVEIESEAVLAR